MKRNLLLHLTAFLCCTPFVMIAQEWEQAYPTGMVAGFPGSGIAIDVKQTNDGGFIILGEANALSGAIRNYIYLVKTDDQGVLEWSKIYNEGMITNDLAGAILVEDDGYLISGTVDVNPQRMLLMKTDANGEILWSQSGYGDQLNMAQTGRALVRTNDGGIFTVGSSTVIGGENETGFLLVKTDASGNELWSNRILVDGFIGDSAFDVIQTTDGNLVICGLYKGQTALIKTDIDGNILWNSFFVDSKYEGGFALVETADSDLLIGNMMTGFAGTNSSGLKTDADGMKIWAKTNGGWGITNDIDVTADGGFVTTGFASNTLGNPSTVLTGAMAKSDGNGITLWSRTLSSTDVLAIGHAIQTIGNDCYIVAGGANSTMFLTKICMGLNPVDQVNETEHLITLFPNPNAGGFQVTLSEGLENEALHFQLFNVLGQQVLEQQLNNVQTKIQTKDLASGTYVYQISSKLEVVQTGRLMVE